eukprot:4479907-Alexandrium_andersonii.AAC.1
MPRAYDARRDVDALLAGEDPIATAGTRPSPFSAVHRTTPAAVSAEGAEASATATPFAAAGGVYGPRVTTPFALGRPPPSPPPHDPLVADSASLPAAPSP